MPHHTTQHAFNRHMEKLGLDYRLQIDTLGLFSVWDGEAEVYTLHHCRGHNAEARAAREADAFVAGALHEMRHRSMLLAASAHACEAAWPNDLP
ncbi:hypothetical protein [Azospirillum sp. sgz302134]